jgi:hypothetical protein
MQSAIGAEAINIASSLLAQFPNDVRIERGENSVLARPEGGAFEITIYNVGEDAMVSAERWHMHYEDPEQAASCLWWLLTPYYRIVHELKGGVLVAAWLERYEEAGWEPLDPVYFLNPESEQDWVAKPGEQYTHRYIQQAVLPPPRPYHAFVPGAKLDENELPIDFHEGTRIVVVEEPMGPSLF